MMSNRYITHDHSKGLNNLDLLWQDRGYYCDIKQFPIITRLSVCQQITFSKYI